MVAPRAVRITVLAFLLGVAFATQASADAGRDAEIERLGGHLMAAIDKARGDGGAAARIAVWPFAADDIPVAPALADEVNAILVAGMMRRAGDGTAFVARRALKELISDIQQRDPWRDVRENPVAALLRTTADVDVLLIGGMRLDGSALQVHYKAVDRNGRLIAVAGPARLMLSADELGGSSVQPLDQAIRAAAKQLLAHTPGMRRLELAGVRFEATGTQPALGRYLEERMATALQDAAQDALTGRGLVIAEAHDIPAGQLQAMEAPDVKASADALASAAFAEPARRAEKGGTYTLSGSYWDFGATVELRFQLASAGAQTASWRGRVRREGLDGMEFAPHGPPARIARDKALGPASFYLTSARGPDPVYNIGERLNLLLYLGRTSWLYCYYHQADGTTVQFFPNDRYLKRADGPKLEGGRIHVMPGRYRFPFSLEFVAPAGYEMVRCFAAGEDVSARLPEELRGAGDGIVSADNAERLGDIFAGLAGVAVTEARLALTVIDRKAN